MLFNSLQFVIFFPTVVIGYFLLPKNWRWAFLLLASCLFYMAFIPAYILILAATIVVDYFAGIWIEQSTGKRRKWLLILSIISNVGFLAFFKYFNFFGANLNALADLINWNYSIEALSIILPVGLSFHTFQAMSYTIEVYRGAHKAERHFGIYALYVMFFPQLVAGPIERPQNLLHQFREEHKPEYRRIMHGLELMLWGFFKKMVIADNVAAGVNVVYNNPGDFGATSLAIATIFFAYQIYCDFSGYSDIARGAAQVLGFRLMVNFNDPYASKSISEFWKRWHISLSTWFRDYVYIPLGGNRVTKKRLLFNLLFVFLVSGFWHGANWTFILWGAIHGTYLIFSIITEDVRKRLVALLKLDLYPRVRGFLSVMFIFVLANIAWIFFRANSIGDAWYILTHIFSGGFSFDNYALTLSKGRTWFEAAVLGIVFLEAAQWAARHFDVRALMWRLPTMFRFAVYAMGVVIILIAGADAGAQFIYFQF